MRGIVRLIAGALAVCACGWAVAQEAAAPENGRKADHAALRALRVKVTDALNNRHAAALCEAMAKEFVYTGVDQSVLTTTNDVHAYIQRVFKAPNAPVRAMSVDAGADVVTRFVADGVGVCHGRAVERYLLRNGTRVTLPSRWTAVCVKEGGLWKVSALHSGVNALNNPVLRAVRSQGTRSAVVMLIAGVLLGIALELIVRRVTRRRSPA